MVVGNNSSGSTTGAHLVGGQAVSEVFITTSNNGSISIKTTLDASWYNQSYAILEYFK